MSVTKKCNAKEQKWCIGVQEIFKFGDPDSGGLHVAGAYNSKTKKRGFGLLYRVYRKGFSWLDYCPFCGADVRERT